MILSMPHSVRAEWKRLYETNDMPNLAHVIQTMSEIADNLESRPTEPTASTSSGTGSANRMRARGVAISQEQGASGRQLACHNCSQPHPISKCPEFLQMAVPVRRDRVRELRLCVNCLSPNHSVKSMSCRSGPCGRCGGNRHHNSLLCMVPLTEQ